MDIKEINKQIKEHYKAIKKLKKEKAIYYCNNPKTKKEEKEDTYKKCSRIAEALNNFYKENDVNKKYELFTSDIYKIGKKENGDFFTTKEMIENLNNIQNYLHYFLGVILNSNAKDYFISLYHWIETYKDQTPMAVPMEAFK